MATPLLPLAAPGAAAGCCDRMLPLARLHPIARPGLSDIPPLRALRAPRVVAEALGLAGTRPAGPTTKRSLLRVFMQTNSSPNSSASAEVIAGTQSPSPPRPARPTYAPWDGRYRALRCVAPVAPLRPAGRERYGGKLKRSINLDYRDDASAHGKRTCWRQRSGDCISLRALPRCAATCPTCPEAGGPCPGPLTPTHSDDDGEEQGSARQRAARPSAPPPRQRPPTPTECPRMKPSI